jgi:DNA-binding LacI/PurR family transcriptional regulator
MDRAPTTAANVTAPAAHKRPTIADVAKLCGVTPATVSRVLNRKREFYTTDAVREKIHETARSLGYVPDLAARNLNRGSARIVGVFASPRTHIAEGINESLLEGIAAVLHGAGYEVFFELSRPDGDRPLPFWRFDGAILMQAPKPETVAELGRRRVPYVCINERVGHPVAHVLADDAMGMNAALDHLAALGHRRIAYANAPATYLSHYSVPERHDTLLAGSRQRGLELAAGHDQPLLSPTQFLDAAVNRAGATAVITYDHHIAVMLVNAAYVLGLRIPGDFSLVCFNDQFPVALLPPPLTAVAVSAQEMGRIGAELLLKGLPAIAEPGAPKEIRVPEALVVRASTAPPPARATREE